MEQMIEGESISQECAEFLATLVKAGYNIFISGGTGSGKTTFLNALSEFIPKTERVITIEDSAELQIQGNAGYYHTRFDSHCATYAPRSNCSRRNPRGRVLGHAASYEYRARRLFKYRTCQ